MTMLPNRRLSCNARGDSHFKRTGTCACLTFKGLEQFGASKWVQPKEEVPFRTLSWNKMWQKIMCWFRLSTSWGEKNFKLHLQNRIIPLRRTFQNFWWVPLLFIWEFSPWGLMSRIHIDPHKYALHSNFRSTFIAVATLDFTHWWHFSWFSKISEDHPKIVGRSHEHCLRLSRKTQRCFNHTTTQTWYQWNHWYLH